MEYSLKILRHMFEIMVPEFYPHMENFQRGFYTLDDLLDQLVFEFLKEENKAYGETNTITYYLRNDKQRYDPDANPAQYSKDIARVQKVRDAQNTRLEEYFGIRLDELNPEDMSSPKRFGGRKMRRDEFLTYWLDYQTGLFSKLHGHQISDSHKVSNGLFRVLFDSYYDNLTKLMPRVNDPDLIVPHTMLFYGIETHFLTHFLYNVTLSAEKCGFPKPIFRDRILHFCGITPYYPDVEWCPSLFAADFCMLMKWHELTDYIFTDDEALWDTLASLIDDCKRIKNKLLQNMHDKVVDIVHQCTLEDKNNFILDHYWCWDTMPVDGFEWTDPRIHYFREIYEAVTDVMK